jgi:succinyl-CoA synthetase alpha subunit
VVQGLTGGQGRFHGLRNKAYGTQVVAGVTPGKGGQDVEGIPVFDTVAEAVAATGANASFVSVPPRKPPARPSWRRPRRAFRLSFASPRASRPTTRPGSTTPGGQAPGTRLLGPNCPGIISPGQCNIGITAGEIALPGGPVGIVSRSGTLTYQALYELKQLGVGVTTCVGIGGDPVPGTNFVDCLAAFEADPDTLAISMFGEIGGSEEEKAADFIAASVTKPVVAYIAGSPPLRERRWATPAPSSPAPRAPPRPRWRPSPPLACTSSTTPPRPASEDGRDRQGALSPSTPPGGC